MKKVLLSLAILLGFVVAQAAPVDAVYTAEPADNSTYAQTFTGATLTFTDVTSLQTSGDFENLIAVTLNGNDAISSIGNYKAQGNQFIFALGRSTTEIQGTFVFSFKDGALIADGNPVKAFKYTVTLDKNYTPPTESVWSPKEGDVESLNVITMQLPGLQFQSDADLQVTLLNKTTGKSYTQDYPEADNNLLTMTFNGKTPITEPGEYELTIPAGMYWVNSYGDSEKGNSPEYKGHWTIKAPLAGAVDFSSVLLGILPNDTDITAAEAWEGAVYAGLTFNGNVAVNKASTGVITMTLDGEQFCDPLDVNSKNIVINSASPMADEAGATTDLQMLFKEIEGKAGDGEYVMSIPEGFFTCDGKPMSSFKYTWKIQPSILDYTYSFSPKPGEFDIKDAANKSYVTSAGNWYQFRLAMGKLLRPVDLDTEDTKFPICTTPALLKDAQGNVVCTFDQSSPTFDTQQVKVNKGDYMFDMRNAGAKNGINVNGKYTLTIPDGFFVDSRGIPYKGTEVEWNLTGGVNPDVVQKYTMSPEPGSYDEYPTVTFTYENCTKIEVAEGAKAKVLLTNVEIGECTITTNGTNTVTFTPTKSIKDQAPSEYSVYRLVVPAEAYKLTINGTVVENEAVQLDNTYKINAPTPAPLTLNPKDNAYLTSVDELKYVYYTTTETTNFDLAKRVRLYPVVEGVRQAEPVATYSLTKYDDNSGEFAMALTTEGTMPEIADGDYELVLPAGLYRVNIAGVSRQSKEQVALYHLGGDNPKPEVTIVTNPTEGQTVDNAELDIVVTFEGATEVTTDSTHPLVLTSGENKVQLVGIASANKVTYMVLTPLANGEWTATLAANSVKTDGADYDKEITWKFTVDVKQGAELTKPTVEPAEGNVTVDELKRVVLTLGNGEIASKLGEEDTYMITLNDAAGFGVVTYKAEISEFGNQVILTAVGEDITLEAGNYTLSIWANTYFVGEQGNPAWNYTYTVADSSVDGIAVDEASEYNVYTVQGICVLRNAQREDLQLLPAGLYIVNGKKLVIRK